MMNEQDYINLALKFEILPDIDKKIEDLKQKKYLLENTDFVNLKPTEEQWHQFMDTDIRCCKTIVNAMVNNLYPDATNFNLGCNYAIFELQGVTVGISTSRVNECVIFENKKDKGCTFFNLTSDKIDNLKQVIDRLSEFTNRNNINFYHYYQRNRTTDIKADKFISIVEDRKYEEPNIEQSDVERE